MNCYVCSRLSKAVLEISETHEDYQSAQAIYPSSLFLLLDFPSVRSLVSGQTETVSGQTRRLAGCSNGHCRPAGRTH